MTNWLDVLPATQIPPGTHHVIVKEGVAIAVFNIEGKFYAIEDSCTHQGLPLSDGFQEEDKIICPFHGAKFCIKSGRALSSPAYINLKTFDTRLVADMVQVKV
ncbi:non-heme iron oxygenase ferredoxin subunit [Candidatus Berkiella cookevillensis]|uniref:Naphthalene 1,2-dioxygenase/salicylate 5-hydroxylase system, ferredoxin component n=1 Tax=Candidatus Berkiella cookevillensis TaxID=437022 RepID=A0A0Q9YFI5_9GAMM|nr:non-heme iron oxygenase ferredoxin subunit [Candidatus Berkiella cookevillensis]MCS5708883.1 non-heme iron oxygenase ferredoxin subunit [Candidatus Berkiella cookevillensis]